jgi:ornithine--oxo-acid transaminase
MNVIKPGQHGSTLVEIQLRRFCAALEVVREENLSVNAERLGVLRKGLNDIASRNSLISLVRGKGLLNAIVIATRNLI